MLGSGQRSEQLEQHAEEELVGEQAIRPYNQVSVDHRPSSLDRIQSASRRSHSIRPVSSWFLALDSTVTHPEVAHCQDQELEVVVGSLVASERPFDHWMMSSGRSFDP